MKIAIGSDERTYLTDAVLRNLQERGHELLLFGHLTEAKGNWPRIAQHVAESVAQSTRNSCNLV